jgi:hypothetical protein
MFVCNGVIGLDHPNLILACMETATRLNDGSLFMIRSLSQCMRPSGTNSWAPINGLEQFPSSKQRVLNRGNVNNEWMRGSNDEPWRTPL